MSQKNQQKTILLGRSIRKIGYFLTICLFATQMSCVPTKNLKKDQYLFFNQTIKGAEEVDVLTLETYYRQKTNRKILYMPIMPYLSAYYLGKKSFDKNKSKYKAKQEEKIDKLSNKLQAEQASLDSLRRMRITVDNAFKLQNDTLKVTRSIAKLENKRDRKKTKMEKRLKNGNWLMQSVGEPPSIYDSANIAYTVDQMTRHLHTKGYFAGYVESEVDTSGKKVSVTYLVTENQPHIIDSLSYDIADSTLALLVQKHQDKSLLKEGEQYDQEKIEGERARLLRLVKNNGYYSFVKSYILFEVDTFGAPYQTHIETIIRNPPGQTAHKVYRIDQVVVETDVDINRQRTRADTIRYKDVVYIQDEQRYSERVLNEKLFVRKDSLYSQEMAEETQKAFANLGVFKFVNIKYDTLGDTFKANIFTSPYPKYQLTGEGGLNVTQSLPGPFLSFSLIDRNIFNGAETFELRLRFSIEAQAGIAESNPNYNSQQWGINSSISFPRILFPIPTKLKRKVAYRSPKTIIQGGYSFVDRQEYNRKNIQGSISYQWLNKKNSQFNISLLELSVVNTPRISEAFEERLIELEEQGSTIRNSFDNSLVTSSTFSYTRSNRGTGDSDRRLNYTYLFLESGGAYLNLLNQGLLNDSTIFGLRYFRFYKLSVDQRVSIPVGARGQLASRIHAGFAKAYGGGSSALPYEKYFFTGGSNSNRAWRARRVGPGSFMPEINDDGTFDYRFEQNGEILIEMNLELRGNLVSYLDYALFVDASNIWMTTEDKTREGAKFEFSDFWREFAVGAGIGFRVDFSFLLIRCDIGTKIYDPARERGQRYIGNKINWKNPFGEPGQTIVNIGIGYPF